MKKTFKHLLCDSVLPSAERKTYTVLSSRVVLRFLLSLLLVGAILLGVSLRSARASREGAKDNASIKAALMEDRGFSCRRQIQMSELDQGEHMWIQTTLYNSHDYVVIGAGDDGISDLDLELYDRRFSLIASDNDSTNTPIVSVQPLTSSAKAYIKVVAYRGEGWATAVICHRRRN